MKTYEDFLKEKEESRRLRLRPGNQGYNGNNTYMGIVFDDGRYTLFVDSEVRINNLEFTTVANSLCDAIEEDEFPEHTSYDLNFSDEFPQPEKDFLRRLTKIVKQRGIYKKDAHENAELAESRRGIAIRGANAGLRDKFR